MSDKLPQKEAGLFKKIVRSYECKQYKNGLKFAKQVLSNPKCAEHGETLAMKGLILNCMGRKEDAYDHVKRGLRNDLRSHVCWHVFGLLQRSDRKYDEAIKCYRNALKWDKENIQILRDLSLLQLQMRDLEGFKETRHQLLKLRPTQRGSWIGLVLAYHLVKDYDTALGVLAEYRATQRPSEEHKVDYEYSEMIMYEAQMLWESGKVDDCLRHVTEFQDTTGDELAVKEMLGNIYFTKGNLKEAQKLYFELISRNTENRLYYDMLERCLALNAEEKRLNLYCLLQKKFPKSALLKAIPLEIATGKEFTTRVTSFLKVSFLKGVPSIFVRLKQHYKDPFKAKTIEEVVEGFLSCLHSNGKLCSEDEGRVAPSVELWLLHFLAQHYDYMGQTTRAMELIDRAIDHTPTLPELYMAKAKIYKHGGDYGAAARMMEEAQSLDTADRFINCKCCKYLMRVNQIEKAVELVALFTREGLPPLETLNDAECNWFEASMAWSYFRLGRIGDALKKCHQIDKHFTDIIDDQFDFHSYCMRKMTLRPYVRMLQMETSVRGHSLYFSAAKLAIEIYISLHDKPSKSQQENGEKDDESGLSTEERKKREKKRRKAELKAKNLQMKESKKEQGKPIENDKKLDLMAEKKDDFIPQELVAVSLFVCYGLGCLWMVVLFVFCVYCKLWSHFLID
jgi:peptide alpha-N-acetyltransferase